MRCWFLSQVSFSELCFYRQATLLIPSKRYPKKEEKQLIVSKKYKDIFEENLMLLIFPWKDISIQSKFAEI